MSTDAKRNAVRTSRRVECALMPDLYVDESSIEKVVPNVVDEVPPTGAKALEFDSSADFNPYDPGVMYKK